MEIMGVIYIIFGILNIILFFKIWGMCNNVSKILKLMEKDKNKEEDKKAQINNKASHIEPQLKKSRTEVVTPTSINPWE